VNLIAAYRKLKQPIPTSSEDFTLMDKIFLKETRASDFEDHENNLQETAARNGSQKPLRHVFGQRISKKRYR
jgi:hypothetical protein